MILALAATLTALTPATQATPATPATQAADTLKDGTQLIHAMHDRYEESWYRTLTFEQKTTFFATDGSVRDEQTWSEYMRVPGRLRIEVGARESGNGILFRSDSVYQFRGGDMVGSGEQVHPLLVLGFDVYGSDPAETIEKLQALGFDLSKLREDVWQDRPVYVVGADDGDEKASQFWIDKEHLLFVRQIQPAGPDGAITAEVQFNRYERLEGGWLAPEVMFFNDEELTMLEEYSLMQADVDLEDALFDPTHW